MQGRTEEKKIRFVKQQYSLKKKGWQGEPLCDCKRIFLLENNNVLSLGEKNNSAKFHLFIVN
jgi:hypothetical protein